MSQQVPQPTDFTIHSLPSLAVPCPDCKKKVGVMCGRPSGHQATEPHLSRRQLADKVFIEQHGEDASVDLTPDGYVIDPHGISKRLAREAKARRGKI